MLNRLVCLFCGRSPRPRVLWWSNPSSATTFVINRRRKRLSIPPKLCSETWATELINNCSDLERKQLLEALERVPSSKFPTNNPSHVSYTQLRLVFLASATPFIGFGFLDNFIMIVAGEYVDMTLATLFGFSTMAAAGIGNLISDLCGLGLVGYVERYASLFGVEAPIMTDAQMNSTSVRRCSNLGRMFGITVGCFVGMLPLLFFSEEGDVKKAGMEEKKETGK